MRSVWLLAGATIAAMAAPAWAQAPEGAPVVSEIHYTGAVVEEDRLRVLTALKVGQPYSPAAVRDSLKAFYQKGLWASVTVETTPGPDNSTAVTFRFFPQALLTEWRFNGNRTLDANTLARTLGLTWGAPLNPRLFPSYTSLLQERYLREGFFNVQARYSVEPVSGQRVRLVVDIDEGRPLTLSAVKLLGTGPLSEREVLDELGVKPGDRLPRDTVFQAIDRLETKLSLGGYLNSRVSYFFQLPDGDRATSYTTVSERNPASVVLTLGIVEGTRGVVVVEGDVLLSEQELSEAITIYRNRSYSAFELDFSANRLREAYVANGFPQATVTNTVVKQPDNTYRITFTVDAGPHVTVKAVEFSGNKAFSADTLRQLVRTQPPRGMLGGGAFVPEVWAADLANVQNFYQGQGFLQATVTEGQRVIDEQTGQITAVATIHEGPRSVVSRLIFKGATPAQEAGLLQSLPINPGDPYNPFRMGDYIAYVEAFFAKTGYPISRVSGRFEADGEPSRGALVFDIQSGPRKRFGQTILRGNLTTKDWVVRRQLATEPGALYNAEDLLRSQQQIYQLGFFDRVDIQPLRAITADPNEPVDLVAAVHERETGWVAIGGGFGNLQGPQASAEYSQLNLLGTGRPTRLEGVLSERRTSGVFTLRDPYLLGADLVGEAGVSYLRESPTIGLDMETYGPSVGFSRQVTDFLLASARYSWSRTYYRNATQEELARIGGQRERVNSIFTTGLTFDSRNDLLNPRWGTRTEAAIDLATPLLGGTLIYARPRVTWAHYIPLPRRVTLALGAELGYVRTFREAEALPTDILFLTGGGNTMRGYAFNTLGANGEQRGGQALGLTHIELRFPVAGDLGGVVFSDAGNVWGSVAELGLNGLRVTGGVGVRYLTPIGPLRLDYAFRIIPELDFGLGPGRSVWDFLASHLYFGIGQAF